jgi:hypothetical protein
VAPWALTIVAGGGQTILPREPFIPHADKQNGILPTGRLILWPYTDFTDTRWTFGKRYVRLKTDENLPDPQKVGMSSREGWAGYALGTTLFVKRFPFIEKAEYPDMGANVETFTAGKFMEVETVAPMHRLNWGETATHTERWRLFKDVDLGATEATIDAALAPLLAQFPK